MKALVTGASGFVGYAVVKELLAAGVPVKAMVRRDVPPHLNELNVEICHGDLCDRESLSKALDTCDHLFHVAAHYQLWDKDPGVFYRINVEGTKNILTLAADRGFTKIVYTSSVATIKPPEDEKAVNEEHSTQVSDLVGDYKKSKYLAEKEALYLVEQGAKIVIVNPSAPIGPYDVKPTPTGKIILDFLKGKMFGYLHTGLNLVAVEDVARGHLLAAEKGQIGRRYILGNENLYLIDIFRLLEKVSGISAPQLKVPYWLAYSSAVASGIWAGITGKSPGIPLDGVRMARKCMFFDSSRAIKELGYQTSPIGEALERAVIWFRKNKFNVV